MAKLYASKSAELSEREVRNMERSRKIASQGMTLLKNNGVLPLKGVKTLAAYGAGVRHTIKGGTGSGDVNSRTVVNVEQGLKEAGYELTSTAWLDRYDKACEDEHAVFNAKVDEAIKEATKTGDPGAVMALVLGHGYKDPAPVSITEEDLAVKADAALYVISRDSGEGGDRSPVAGDYELFPEEEQNIRDLGKVYDSVVVALNVGGVIDTKFLRSCPNVGAILYMSQAGNISGFALADVISGKVNPSGHLTTTWAENYTDYPCAETFSHLNGDVDDEYYREGIYVGYRYFDSFNVAPAYPFGFGLSYTDFSIKTESVAVENANVIVKATVTNTGSEYSGKEVVQVYVSAPAGHLETPYQELKGFAKTKELAPGESETVTVCFPVGSMASYCEKHACYVLKPGKYLVRVGEDSRHTHIAAALDLPEKKIVSQLKNLVPLDEEMETLHPTGAPYGYEGEEEEKAAAPVITLNPAEIPSETVTYSEEPKEMTTDKTETITIEDVISGKAKLEELVAQLSVEQMADLCVGTARGTDIGANSNIGVASNAVPGAAGDTTSELIESRGIPNIVLADGPAGLRLTQHFVADHDGKPIQGLGDSPLSMPGMPKMPAPERPDDATDYYQFCTAIPIATLLAMSWDMDVVSDAGDIVGGEMEDFGVHLWLAPGMCIHRNPLCGRNFEYYSEDPLIAGLCAAADTKGVQKHPGRGTCIKHYALNNQEENRYGVNSHCTERAIREIYVKGFEIAVKVSQPLSLMTSYNLINGKHAANNHDTVTAMLRDEWGFEGLVMTDWGTTGMMGALTPGKKYPDSEAAGCVKAGNDLTMPGNERDIESILTAVNAKEGEVNYPLTKAELQACSYHILKVIIGCEKAIRG